VNVSLYIKDKYDITDEEIHNYLHDTEEEEKHEEVIIKSCCGEEPVSMYGCDMHESDIHYCQYCAENYNEETKNININRRLE